MFGASHPHSGKGMRRTPRDYHLLSLMLKLLATICKEAISVPTPNGCSSQGCMIRLGFQSFYPSDILLVCYFSCGSWKASATAQGAKPPQLPGNTSLPAAPAGMALTYCPAAPSSDA